MEGMTSGAAQTVAQLSSQAPEFLRLAQASGTLWACCLDVSIPSWPLTAA